MQCHCNHNSCVELAKKRRSCLCGQFLLVFCGSAVPVSGQTWADVLTTQLKELTIEYVMLDEREAPKPVTYRFWGNESILQSGTGEDHDYVYRVVFEVWDSEDRDRIMNHIDGQYVKVQHERSEEGEQGQGDFEVSFHCHRSCCVQQFFTEFNRWQMKDVSVATFGVGTVLSDVEELHNDFLNLG